VETRAYPNFIIAKTSRRSFSLSNRKLKISELDGFLELEHTGKQKDRLHRRNDPLIQTVAAIRKSGAPQIGATSQSGIMLCSGFEQKAKGK
jgi:hypothetical protein